MVNYSALILSTFVLPSLNLVYAKLNQNQESYLASPVLKVAELSYAKKSEQNLLAEFYDSDLKALKGIFTNYTSIIEKNGSDDQKTKVKTHKTEFEAISTKFLGEVNYSEKSTWTKEQFDAYFKKSETTYPQMHTFINKIKKTASELCQGKDNVLLKQEFDIKEVQEDASLTYPLIKCLIAVSKNRVSEMSEDDKTKFGTAELEALEKNMVEIKNKYDAIIAHNTYTKEELDKVLEENKEYKKLVEESKTKAMHLYELAQPQLKKTGKDDSKTFFETNVEGFLKKSNGSFIGTISSPMLMLAAVLYAFANV